MRSSSSPHHQGFVDGVPELEGVVTDGQVVLQSERLQHHAVSDRECQPQVVAGITFGGKGVELSHGIWTSDLLS